MVKVKVKFIRYRPLNCEINNEQFCFVKDNEYEIAVTRRVKYFISKKYFIVISEDTKSNTKTNKKKK